MNVVQRAAVVVVVVLGGLALSSPPGGSLDFASYRVGATAELALVEVYDTRAPVVPEGQVVSSTPATAQVELDSLGASRGFASAPYPGATVVSLPGTISGLGSGSIPSLPSYPAFVGSDHPLTPEAEVDQGAYQLRSRSDATSSESEAVVAALDDATAIGAGRAHSAVSSASGSITARAHASVTGFRIDDLLTVGDVQSVAELVVGADGEAVTDSSFSATGLEVAGVGLVIDGDGISLAGQALPIDALPVEALLEAAGVALEVIPGEVIEGDNGELTVRSAGLQIVTESNGPDGSTTTLRYILGQTWAIGRATPIALTSPGGSPSPVDQPTAESAPLVPPAASPPLGSTPAPLGPPVADIPQAPLPSPVEPGVRLAALPLLPPEADTVYLLIGLGGVLSVIGSRLMAHLGLRAESR